MRLSSPAAVQGHPAFGSLFESMVVMECYKQLQKLPLIPALYHYRQHGGTEVDLVIEKDGRMLPVEIKSSSQVRPGDSRPLRLFREKLGGAVGPGLIVYAGTRILKIDDNCLAVPFDLS